MKVIFEKKHKMGTNEFKKGDNAIIIDSLGKELIKKKICIQDKFVILQEEATPEPVVIPAKKD